MKHHYFFKVMLFCFVMVFAISSVNAQRHHYGAYIGAAIPVGKFASDKDIIDLMNESGENVGMYFCNAASAGVSFTGRYYYLWDGVFTEKDALGVFGEVSLIWNSVRKEVKNYYSGDNSRIPSYLSYSLAVGPTYHYYIGKDEKLSVFGELGVVLGSYSLTKSSDGGGLGIGAVFGAGITYDQWLSVGAYYQFFNDITVPKTKYGLETIPSVLQLKVGFHF